MRGASYPVMIFGLQSQGVLLLDTGQACQTTFQKTVITKNTLGFSAIPAIRL
jgi:hypothetical protein